SQPHHCKTLATALSMPDDSTFSPANEGLSFFHAEVLVWAAEFFYTSVKNNEVVNDFKQSFLFTKLKHVLIEDVLIEVIGALVFFPFQEKLFGSFNCAIVKSLTVVACQHQLYRGKERFDKTMFLVVETLPDAF